jgi:hypothetical protein
VTGSTGTEKTITKRSWISTTATGCEGSGNTAPLTKIKKMDKMTEEDKVIGKEFREFVQQYDPDGRMGPLEFFNTYPQVRISLCLSLRYTSMWTLYIHPH